MGNFLSRFKLTTRAMILLGVVGIVCICMSIYMFLTIRDQLALTVHEKLKSDAAVGLTLLNDAHPGDWSIRDGKLFKGETAINENYAVIDRIATITGDTVTVFGRDTRVATTILNGSGGRAIGTRAADNVIEAVLKRGQPYAGKADVAGKAYLTSYQPMKGPTGEILGMFFVGIPNARYDEIANGIIFRMLCLGLVGFVVILYFGFMTFRSITKPIGYVVAGLGEGSEKVASASCQVSSSSQNLSEGASEQAATMEETASATEEMAAMTRQNAANAGSAKTMMEEARVIVEDVNVKMQHMSDAMRDLIHSSEETGKIIKTIDEIAFQTNLLALNAAVEAARAGDVGAGFAVVADEVRGLARRAAEAARQTNDLIDKTIDAVKQGSALTGSTREAFGKNMDISMKISTLIDEIDTATSEQARGIEQINLAIRNMNGVVQSTASNAEQSAAAAQEMNAQAETMKGFVVNLVEIVNGTTV